MTASWHDKVSSITSPLWENLLITSGFPSQRANNEELWCFLCYLPERTVELLVIWQRLCCHGNRICVHFRWSPWFGWSQWLSDMHIVEWSTWLRWAGGWFSIKMSSYQYRKSHCGDKMVLWLSCLHNGIYYTGKMASLYWIRALVGLW